MSGETDVSVVLWAAEVLTVYCGLFFEDVRSVGCNEVYGFPDWESQEHRSEGCVCGCLEYPGVRLLGLGDTDGFSGEANEFGGVLFDAVVPEYGLGGVDELG